MLDIHAPWWPTTVPTSMCKYSLDHLQINAPAPWTDASTSSGRLFLPKHMSAYDLFLYFFEAYIYFLENLVSSLKFLYNVKWVSWVFLSFVWLFTYDTVILMFILPTPRSKCSLITVVRETFETIVINQGTFMKKATSLQHTDGEWALAHWKSKGNPDLFTCEHLPSCVISRRSFPLHASAVKCWINMEESERDLASDAISKLGRTSSISNHRYCVCVCGCVRLSVSFRVCINVRQHSSMLTYLTEFWRMLQYWCVGL